MFVPLVYLTVLFDDARAHLDTAIQDVIAERNRVRNSLVSKSEEGRKVTKPAAIRSRPHPL